MGSVITKKGGREWPLSLPPEDTETRYITYRPGKKTLTEQI